MLQRRLNSLIIVVMLTISITSNKSYAWGQNGHRIIAKIAEQHLTLKTKKALIPLLESESLPQISTWPDEMRSDPANFWQKKSSRWHYINFEPSTSPSTFLDSSDNQHTHTKDTVSNILQGMQYAIATLKKADSSADEKRFALRFLVHLVGDSHQPFHAGRGEDRGGNRIEINYFGEKSNLHSLWDTKIIESKNLSYTEFADFINTDNASLIAEYLKSTPQGWLIESHHIAESIYKKNVTDIDYNYVYTNLPIIKTRLQQGGIRLAGLLNMLFDESAQPLVSALKMQTNNKVIN